MASWHRAHSDECFFQLLIPGWTHVSLLESESVFETVTQLADTGMDHVHFYSLQISHGCPCLLSWNCCHTSSSYSVCCGLMSSLKKNALKLLCCALIWLNLLANKTFAHIPLLISSNLLLRICLFGPITQPRYWQGFVWSLLLACMLVTNNMADVIQSSASVLLRDASPSDDTKPQVSYYSNELYLFA
jgi:hypothetical protein